MAKKVNWTSNLRVDLDDLEQGTHGYASDIAKEFVDRTFKDFYPRVAEGFRVEIADTANRVITVYSGVAADQNGQLVNNEEAQSTSRSLTLTGDATHYIEIEFVETLGTTDARAFWDPTFDNGLDTSGDVLPDGRESSQNISTRKTHDWQIVDPPSTTGFEITTTPTSARIPVAAVTVAGGVITAPTGTSIARTTFARTYSSGVTSIRGLNTRIFPDAFTARLGSGLGTQEDISVTANDRENGILTLGAGTSNAHDVGERILNQGSTVLFIDEAVAMDETTGTDGGGPVPNVAGDGRTRMFQGDTEAGYALSQDPAADTGESDIQIKNLKEQVDYLASQVLEMKYGAGSRDLLGTIAPPNSFAAADTQHFARSGGIINARSNTVSVGDGVGTWGDFNTTTSGSAQAALQAAFDALPAGGGTVYVKGGTYDIVNTAPFTVGPVAVVGDPGFTIIRSTGTAVALDVQSSDPVAIHGVNFMISGGSSTYALELSGDMSLHMTNCTVHGIDNSGAISDTLIEKCAITASANGSFGLSGTGNWSTTTFNRCSFTNAVAAAGSRCIKPNGSDQVVFNSCSFAGNGTMAALIELPAAAIRTTFNDCRIRQTTGVATALFFTAAGGTELRFAGCEFDCIGGVGIFDGAEAIHMSDCAIAVPQDGSSLMFDGNSVGIVVDGCIFTQATTTALETGIGLDLADVAGVKVVNCEFLDCDEGLTMWTINGAPTQRGGVIISGCHFTKLTAGRGRRGITTGTNAAGAAAFSNLQRIHISDCVISGLQDATATSVYGIFLENYTTGSAGTGFEVTGCSISSVGDPASGNTTAAAIRFATNGATENPMFFQASVSGCAINGITAGTTAYGVFFENVRNAVATGNSFRSIAGDATIAEAVFAEHCNVVNISNNAIQGLGNAAIAVAGGVIHIGDVSQTIQNDSIVIANNTIDGCSSSGNNYYGINLDDNARYVAVTGNVITNPTSMGKGIYCSIDDVDEGQILINDNIIMDFEDQGIYVWGSVTGGRNQDISICNNILTTSSSDGGNMGMYLRRLTGIVVCGNSISFSSSASYSHDFILMQNITGFVVSNNRMRTAATGTVNGVETSDGTSIQGVAHGNYMLSINDTGGDFYNGGTTNTNTFFSGNFGSMSSGNDSGSGGGFGKYNTSGSFELNDQHI